MGTQECCALSFTQPQPNWTEIVNKKLKFPPTLLRAIQEGQLGLVQQLLESGSDASGAGPGGPMRNVEESEDRSWREALNLAIRLGHEVITDVLLANVKFDFRQIHEALLVAVDTNQPAVVRRLLARLEREKGRKVDTKSFSLAFFDSSIDGSRFAPGVTPLTLACQKDLYEIAQLLMDQGHTIARPHPVSCACLECSNARRYDLLKFSLSRINTYRGIASRAHLSLASEDAMLAAFQLSRELRRLARKEPEFKVCYCTLNSILPSVPRVCCCTGTGLGFVVAVLESVISGEWQTRMKPLVLRATILFRTGFHSSDSHLREEYGFYLRVL